MGNLGKIPYITETWFWRFEYFFKYIFTDLKSEKIYIPKKSAMFRNVLVWSEPTGANQH